MLFRSGENRTAVANFNLLLEPSGSIVPAGNNMVNSKLVPLTLSATSPVSAMSKMQFSVNQGPWGALLSYATNYSLQLTGDDGLYEISVRFQDANGNFSPSYSTTVIVDTTRPVISMFDIPENSNSEKITVISLIATDQNGITGYYLSTSATAPSVASTEWSPTVPLEYVITGIVPGTSVNKIVYAFAKDGAGNISLVASKQITVYIPKYLLSLKLDGTGRGTVNSDPSGIHCDSGTCSNYFDIDSSVTLMPTASWNSNFKGWIGDQACGVTGTCIIKMNDMKSIIAQFEGKPSYLVWLVEGAKNSAYYSINDACSAVNLTGTIQAQNSSFAEDVTISTNTSKDIMLQGGYDSMFKQRSGYTVIDGVVTIGRGVKLTVDRIIIK